jgi:hypothetical protein
MPKPGVMNVFLRPDLHSKAPATSREEPGDPVFSGSPTEVAAFLGPKMEQRTHTLTLVAAELKHLARAGWATDHLTFVLQDDTSVTVRP